MSTKNEQPAKAGKGENNATLKKVENGNKPTAKKAPTVEELQKTVENLQKKLAAVPNNLDERIAYFQQKKVFIDQLAKLEAQEAELQKSLDTISDKAAENEFLTEEFSLLLTEKHGYGSPDTIWNFKNPIIIGEVIDFVLQRIAKKREELKLKIEA